MTPDDAPTEGESHSRHTILIVDDEPDTRDSVADVIAAALPTARILRASSGFEGIEKLREVRVDAIISDYKMPRMNGIQFLVEAGEVAPEAPRILMTAYADLNVAVNAINQARVRSFFMKPLQADIVVEAVKDALGIPD